MDVASPVAREEESAAAKAMTLGFPQCQDSRRKSVLEGTINDSSRSQNTGQTHWAAQCYACSKSLVVLQEKPERKVLYGIINSSISHKNPQICS